MLIVKTYMKTVIFDGSNLLHRSYWVNSVRPTVATEYLFLNSIRKCISKYQSEDIVCMWDNRNTRDIKNFRQVLTEHNYKATRDKKKTRKVYERCELIQELSQLLGVVHLHPDMLEADDYMNWLSKELDDTVLITSDSDMIQCVSDKCVVYNPIKDVEINVSNFKDITNTSTPDEFVTYKALVGDKSDNIPGVPGIGDKRARQIITSGTIDNLSAEHKIILEKNIKLIDLSVGVTMHENEIPWYRKLYHQQMSKRKLSKSKFKNRCVELRLNNVLRNYSDWIGVFDKTNTIENVVEKLIRLNT